MAVQASGQLVLRAYLESAATVRMAATGSLTWGTTLDGSAALVLAADGAAVRRAMGESSPQVAVKATGDIQAVQAVSATFTIVMRAQGDLKVSKGQQGEGRAPIVIAADVNLYAKPTTRPDGYAGVGMAAAGQGNLRMMLPAGAAVIRAAADGAARFGLRHNIEGAAAVSLFTSGQLGRWRYVFAGATAAIQILAKAERHGTPAISATFVPAPEPRTWRVRAERRDFTVPFERRA